ncbi:MAG: TfoX/Sxy family DNA transformation protein, partial [Alphaproteobacteria bacterium]|nr:TfoX/Sxy family DNA transformation protein [Alphaproteobacteria bacterium]
LREVGINTSDDLTELGAVEAFRRVYFRYQDEMNFTSVYLYALEGALTDTHWNHIPQSRKDFLKEKFKEITGK